MVAELEQTQIDTLVGVLKNQVIGRVESPPENREIDFLVTLLSQPLSTYFMLLDIEVDDLQQNTDYKTELEADFAGYLLGILQKVIDDLEGKQKNDISWLQAIALNTDMAIISRKTFEYWMLNA